MGKVKAVDPYKEHVEKHYWPQAKKDTLARLNEVSSVKPKEAIRVQKEPLYPSSIVKVSGGKKKK